MEDIKYPIPCAEQHIGNYPAYVFACVGICVVGGGRANSDCVFKRLKSPRSTTYGKFKYWSM